MTREAATARERLLRQELARFVDIVAQHMHPERIILFGSLAAGQVDEWSDLDLVVIMDVLVYTPAEWTDMVRQRRFIQQEIFSKGQVVYERAC